MNILKDKKGRTQYCVAIDAILVRDGMVLLQRRANTGWNDGNWNLAGGHIEDEETLQEAVCREMKEELGIQVDEEAIKIVHCTQNKTNRLTMQFYATVEDWVGTPTIQPETDKNGETVYKADKLEWFTPNDLPENTVPTAKQAIECVFNGEPFSKYGFDDRTEEKIQ